MKLRSSEEIQAEYERWLKSCSDKDLMRELQSMEASSVEDAFYRDLAFGTGGLRGILGAGTNRMNIYTVAKASKGLADYIKRHFEHPSIAVSYDSRLKSDTFARTAAEVFASEGIKVFLYPALMPTPCLSFAVRRFSCAAGIMVTASHNPSRYNGYKVYGADGCQITEKAAEEILADIEKLDIFDDTPAACFDAAVQDGRISYIGEECYTAYIEEVKKQSVLFGDEIRRDFAIVYSPLNGTGLKPVTRVLQESGFTNITLVKEQEQPDGNFPTCPYPNPEIREAMELGLHYCEKTGADLLLATDPDCDRCGIAVRTSDGYRLLTGNEVGLLLLDFICSQRCSHHRMPDNPVFVKTVVTMDLAEKIAAHYGVSTINVLTGFKYIGETIGKLEKEGRENDYICGFEESYGYLTGTYVRDKDAVNAALMICEMFAWYKTRDVSLSEKLSWLFEEYGYCMNTLHSFIFDGSSGMRKMTEVMKSLRNNTPEIAGMSLISLTDYSLGINGLPESDVLKFTLKDASVVVRPSGTEPKLKMYISVTAENERKAKEIEESISEYMKFRIA